MPCLWAWPPVRLLARSLQLRLPLLRVASWRMEKASGGIKFQDISMHVTIY